VYLSFQLSLSPLHWAPEDLFIGVVDGMASLVPLGIALVVIFGKLEFSGHAGTLGGRVPAAVHRCD
jgi:hypothetical protein